MLSRKDYTGAQSYIRRSVQQVMQKSSALGSSSMAQEVASYSENNGSPEQKALRSRMFQDEHFFKSIT
jgi:hypothetical protein